MNMKCTEILPAVLIATMSATSIHAEETNSSKAAVVYGLEKSTIVVSGTTQGSATGGGGVTSRLKVDDVFLGNDALKGEVITVFWLDGKAHEDGKRIWFLKPQNQGYKETVGTKYPFVEATTENIRILQSCIQNRQKPNQPSEATH